MQLTAYTDYSLRLMMYLAQRKGQRATVGEIADVFGISRNHLMKVAFGLGQQGWVETTRGRSGGLSLAPGAERVRLGDIIRSTEPDFAVVECFDASRNSCAIVRPCRLKGILQQAMTAWFEVLDAHTLGDLVADNKALARLFAQLPNREVRT